jgi:hypothetical protein
MQVTLYDNKTDKVHTTITAILEYGKLIVSGYDQYLPSDSVPEGSEYEYETYLDMQNTNELFELLGTTGSDQEKLDKILQEFGGERADIRFQAFCFANQIETYCSSNFDD